LEYRGVSSICGNVYGQDEGWLAALLGVAWAAAWCGEENAV